MTRFMLLDSGQALNEENWRALLSRGSPVRVKLLEPTHPFREGQVVQVAPLGAAGARTRGLSAGDLILSRAGSAFRLYPWGGRDAGEPLCRVVAIERGQVVFALERGFLARVPFRWLPRAVDALEVLRRFRHPFTPGLHLGSAATCLEGVRAKYNREAEARQYSSFAPLGLEPFEREVV